MVVVLLFIVILFLVLIGIFFFLFIVILCKVCYMGINVLYCIVLVISCFVLGLVVGVVLLVVGFVGVGLFLVFLRGVIFLLFDDSFFYVVCFVFVLYYVWSYYSFFINKY